MNRSCILTRATGSSKYGTTRKNADSGILHNKTSIEDLIPVAVISGRNNLV